MVHFNLGTRLHYAQSTHLISGTRSVGRHPCEGLDVAKVNRAVIIAVSDYQGANPLPACRKDGTLMRAILLGSGRYAPENTLYIDANATSDRVKSALANFVREAAGQDTGELFFYFTGHGLFDGSEFYHLFTDFG